ncbi:MAG: hypothetical protein ACE5E5_03135 [Phycisphaerae bacterium]
MRHQSAVGITSILVGVLALTTGGCGALATSSYPNQLISADGQAVSIEDLEQIAQRANLSDDDKRAMFRDLGIEDEKLIDALLGL